jgi:signal transduction histidine kinase
MVGLGTLPLTVALLILAIQVRSAGSPAGPRAALDEITESGQRLMNVADTAVLHPEVRDSLHAHAEVIARRTTLARRAETLTRFAAGALGLLIFIVAIIMVVASLMLAGRWSGFVSAPIEELVEWVRRIERREPLPSVADRHDAPEFDALKSALRQMSGALEEARLKELEQERLRAFRETARRVAHEMRGPLTASRLALRQLKTVADEQLTSVLQQETERLSRMAQEFSEFGRLPEGPEAEISMDELIASVVNATVPPEIPVRSEIPVGVMIKGHFEPLRRAVQNLLNNALEATGSAGIEIELEHSDGHIRLSISDHGPGVPDEQKARVFDPYFTTKERGTGLGLALVRQTVVAHGGTIEVQDAQGGGAAFVITLPELA